MVVGEPASDAPTTSRYVGYTPRSFISSSRIWLLWCSLSRLVYAGHGQQGRRWSAVDDLAKLLVECLGGHQAHVSRLRSMPVLPSGSRSGSNSSASCRSRYQVGVPNASGPQATVHAQEMPRQAGVSVTGTSRVVARSPGPPPRLRRHLVAGRLCACGRQ